jgi:hypothetical protein
MPQLDTVPEIRVRRRNELPPRPGGDYVLYWMIAFRRLRSNFALERAAGWSRLLGRPLLIFEPLRCGYRWASARHHRFALDGMAERAAELAGTGVAYYPYVEPRPDAGKGLLAALAAAHPAGTPRAPSGRAAPVRAQRPLCSRRPRPQLLERHLLVLRPLRPAWGPERPIFGTVRYMSSESARRKLRLQGYLDRFGPDAEPDSSGKPAAAYPP